MPVGLGALAVAGVGGAIALRRRGRAAPDATAPAAATDRTGTDQTDGTSLS